MYNKGKLTGFGWDTSGKYDYTKRAEVPTYAALSVSLTLNRAINTMEASESL